MVRRGEPAIRGGLEPRALNGRRALTARHQSASPASWATRGLAPIGSHSSLQTPWTRRGTNVLLGRHGRQWVCVRGTSIAWSHMGVWRDSDRSH